MFPHEGIIHDSRLYVFDILNIAQAGIFANDVLAAIGTQDNYTLYSYIAAPLYKILSPWAATSLVFVAGQLLWFSGIFVLVTKFTEDKRIACFGLLSAFLLPTEYFGFSVLSYGESFATPRLFVEGLTFWSLWSFFSRKYLVSVILVAVALSLHPIMGLIAASLLIATLVQEGRRWWWIFGGAAAVGAAVALGSGVVPVERLTAALEGEWLEVVQKRAKYLYVSEWSVKDWVRITFVTSITVPLLALFSGWQRRLVISALVVGGSGLLLSFIGTDVLHNVLLSQVQTSRAIWFVYLLGNIGLGVVVANMYRRSEEDGDAFFFLYILVWTIAHLLWPIPGIILGLTASLLAYLRLTDKIAGIPSIFRRLIYTLTGMMFFWMAFFRVKFWLIPANRDAIIQNDNAFVGISGFTQMELAFIVFIIFAVVRLRLKFPSQLTLALLILLTAWSISVWDRRSANDRGLEGDYVVDALFDHIPQGAQVYWQGNTKGAWFLLGRPSYFADTLGSGTVFSEPLAVEFLKRGQIIHALDGVDYVDIWRPATVREQPVNKSDVVKELARDDLVTACTNAPALDFLMLTRKIDGQIIISAYGRYRTGKVTPPAGLGSSGE
ncbi:MAG: hypothetical protein GKS02_14640 [Alphaproteobacteria bacterium]|nr:hypothetical protein [Alphaproteobacteria bacterium]